MRPQPFGLLLLACIQFMTVHGHSAFAASSESASALAKRWEGWKRQRPSACSPALDSFAHFQEGNRKVAIVIHGLGSSPKDVQGEIELLITQGYTVLAPRLSRHFDWDIRDLDQASYGEWLQDAQEVFALARTQVSKVTLVGYSLGGLLAANLALAHPNEIEKMILVAPAWRITPGASLAGLVGSVFGLSLNSFAHLPVACKVGEGYVSARAGQQVEFLIMDVESRFNGAYPAVAGSTFAQLKVPFLLVTTSTDQAVDSSALLTICSLNSTYCSPVSSLAKDHIDLGENLVNQRAVGIFNGVPIVSLLSNFLNSIPAIHSLLPPTAR